MTPRRSNGLLLVVQPGEPGADRDDHGGAADDAAATATSTTVAGSDPFVSVLQQQLEDQLGLVITDEQGSCLLDNFGDTDPNDTEAVFALLITCGVDISDVSGG